MEIDDATQDYIADEEGSIPGQALNSKRHGIYSSLARSAQNKPISADVAKVEAAVVADADGKRRYLSGTATGHLITDRKRVTLAAYAGQPGAIQVLS